MFSHLCKKLYNFFYALKRLIWLRFQTKTTVLKQLTNFFEGV